MKDHFGSNLGEYGAPELLAIREAIRYEILLYKLYIAWNFAFMSAGVLFIALNTGWLTTYEMLGRLALFWGVSGLPFFLIKDQVKRKFAAQLPAGTNPPGPAVELLKLLAGFAVGAWATHVMLIAGIVKYFELRGYAGKVAEA